MRMRNRMLGTGGTLVGGLALVTALAGELARAQDAKDDYPSRTITLVVPYPPGGIADTMPRVVAEELRQSWGQPVIVDNRSGASGSVGSAAVWRAKPDGYTLLSAPSSPIVINQFIQKNPGFDPTQLVPVAYLGFAPLVLSIRADLPVKTVQEFAAYAKANPAKLNYASNGVGGGAHIAALLFQNAVGVKDMTQIPYRGNAQALQALMTGEADLFWGDIASTLPFHQGGKIRILAVGSKERVAALPDVPTLAEMGYPDLIISTWFALFAPPKTPATIVAKLSGEIGKIVELPNVKSNFEALGLVNLHETPPEMRNSINADRERRGSVIKEANIPLD
jgi:tripartite-type tricarboxylate transporter receptor subunit TctC